MKYTWELGSNAYHINEVSGSGGKDRWDESPQEPKQGKERVRERERKKPWRNESIKQTAPTFHCDDLEEQAVVGILQNQCERRDPHTGYLRTEIKEPIAYRCKKYKLGGKKGEEAF